MEWTREQRYQPYKGEHDPNMIALKQQVDACPWRQLFHIQPITGLLNDPNGFSYYNGEYHLFYQWFPQGPVHGLKHWYHTVSKDLVHWENKGLALTPDRYYDSHGAFSGSAIEHDGKLLLMYTGNTRDAQWIRKPYQAVASMDEQGTVTKSAHAVIEGTPEGYTDHYRDPKVWKDDKTGRYFAIIGAQRTDETVFVVLYSSPDMQEWSFAGEIKTKLPSFGFMWECPDYVEWDGKGLLLFSPQGIEPEGHQYRNIYQSGYLLGEKLDLESLNFEHGSFQELDRGFDFYAPQSMLTPDGRRVMVGWMGLPEVECPSDAHGWAHCLTLPRVLTVSGDKLIQQPVEELKSLRLAGHEVTATLTDEKRGFEHFRGVHAELDVEFHNQDAKQFGVELRTGEAERTIISYDAATCELTLDRTQSGVSCAEAYGTTRTCVLNASQDQPLKLHIFMDTSSIEVFVNDGEEVFTSRIFPRLDSDGITFFASGGKLKLNASIWQLSSMQNEA